jgi:hypothetical protein
MAYPYGSPYDEEDKRSALTQGLLAAGLAALGARKGSEYNAFAQAGLLGLGGYNRSLENATEARDRKAQREMQAQQYAQQQAEWQRMQQQRAQMEGAQRAATLPGTPGMPAQEADSPGGTYMPPTPGTPGGFDRQKYGQLLEQIDPAKGLAYQQSLAKPTKELSKVENLSFQGKPVTVAFYKDGSREVLPFDPAADKQEVWEDIPQPKGAAPGLQWQRSKTTGQLRSVGSQPPVTNINLGGPKYEPGVGYMYPPSAANPTGRVVQPEGMPPKEAKPLTESQAKATAFVNQMQGANQTLEDLGSKGFTGKSKGQQTSIVMAGAEGMPFIPGSAAIPRMMSGPEAQKYQQAELQWTEAALRFMTGANAPEPEIRRNAATYFPRPGDADAVVEQKARARANMEESIRMAAGATGQKALDQKPASTQKTYETAKSGETYIAPDGTLRRKR